MVRWQVPRTLLVPEDLLLCSSTDIFISPPESGFVSGTALPVLCAPPLAARCSIVAGDGNRTNGRLDVHVEHLATVLLVPNVGPP